MRKKIVSIFLLAVMAFSLTACNPLSFLKSGNRENVITATDGQADGRIGDTMAVSYTHLDVYKRQRYGPPLY